MADESFFQRVTRLFRSGPAIRRKIKGHDPNNYYDQGVMRANHGYYTSGHTGYKRGGSPFSVMGEYGILDRLSKYSEFAEMEYTPEISTALDLYADETCSSDETGRRFHIYSENPKIQKALEELFYEVYNINFEARRDIRNLVKNGDFFRYVEVQPKIGVVLTEPVPVNEVSREEGFDPQDPTAVRFRLETYGGKYLENWQILHFRILSNDAYLPYGTSFLENVRRSWRQLTMIEDAMLVYRMVRSPERRVFYIDISGIKPEDVGNYMEAVKATIRTNTVTNRTQGLTDLRYNPMSVDDDYFLPTRPNSGTKIESLAGGQHVSATEDVEYIRGKVIAGLKVPKAYLGFDEALGSKATLAQEDIRFSKTIQALQEIYIAELNKLAILHLFAIGFQGEDLIDFELKLSNPSSVALQQKLAVISSRIDIAAKAWDLGKETGMVSIPWIQRNILELRGEELNQMFEEAIEDQKRLAFLKFTLESKPEESKDEHANVGEFEKGSVMPELLPPNELQAGSSMVKSVSIAPDSTGLKRAFTGMGLAPVKANQTPAQRNKNAKRNKQFSGQRALMNPGFAAMLDPNNKYTKDVYGQKGSVLLENIEGQIAESQKRGLDIVPNFLPASVRQTLKLFYESRMKEYEVDFESDDIATEMRTLVKG